MSIVTAEKTIKAIIAKASKGSQGAHPVIKLICETADGEAVSSLSVSPHTAPASSGSMIGKSMFEITAVRLEKYLGIEPTWEAIKEAIATGAFDGVQGRLVISPSDDGKFTNVRWYFEEEPVGGIAEVESDEEFDALFNGHKATAKATATAKAPVAKAPVKKTVNPYLQS